jgi:hypothetical protein
VVIRTTIFTIILSLLFASVLLAAQRGIKVTAKTPSGKAIPLYSGSYALVVGNGDYNKGWDPLPGAIRDVKDVARALKENGFKVILKTNLTRNTFRRAFGSFFHKYGRSKTNRLFFYYAGHGYTQRMFTGEDQGYMVMVDAPAPEKDPVGFDIASIDMQVVVTQAKKVKARHVLFMFDSCFSGAILNLRERVIPETISDSVSLPTRQFITAGRANEPVPDHSIFKQAFLDLLEGRDKEPIPDGYITGEELGLYLKNKVPQYNPMQHPQYGKIKDIRLDKGDFVFALKIPSTPKPPAPRQSDGIRDYDKIIKERNANRKKWNSWQKSMETALAKVERYDKSNALNAKEKADAWEGLLASYGADNPYTAKDDEFRKQAEERNLYWKEYKGSAQLFVDTVQTGAKIRILNIGPKFYQGMKLKPGRYHVEASNQGYATKKVWVNLGAGEDKKVAVNLEQLQASIQPTPAYTHPKSSTSNVIKQDGRFIHYDNGIIEDRMTGLQWFLKLDGPMGHPEAARLWAEDLDINGGAWRLPSTNELKSIDEYLVSYFGKDVSCEIWSDSGEIYHLFFAPKGTKKDTLGDWNFLFDGRQLPSAYAFVVRSRNESKSKRDGIYVAYANGIVKDTKTGLEWKVGPDRDTTWHEARSWAQSLNLDGGGWRMPTSHELTGLYKNRPRHRSMTPLLETTGYIVWSSETKAATHKGAFRKGGKFTFLPQKGQRASWSSLGLYHGFRAFAVRSRGDG